MLIAIAFEPTLACWCLAALLLLVCFFCCVVTAIFWAYAALYLAKSVPV